ncbi:MAG: conjugal transfer protein TraG [Hyphomonas sp. BRH_c22]|uniref:IncP-type conjugal transfer protein TraG n=1 Tax=Pyruvatibacter mobilis TaxID=1712261 RepID=A0A845QET3_9HYPH|nr:MULTISPECIES: conjugal transfer protein TraG [Alphaproteobacteria]KJS38622.1 MAG: conjugal transfer protein TraG [Hyphomonas sp. BRH_c22]NBG97062.1 IncP-type conjugal transfer protein TraG [Pyruvatibacter mobilis]QJD76029.1 conjugal transfer protein TraG [Pyruvatibacter mobilis]GGD20556.1 conjugal transfer protein TraG [Pyruvatibacter mobilis]
MTGTKVLIGTFCLVCLIILFSMWGATQWTAEALGFQPGLGRPWFMLGDTPVYRPWRLFQWWYAYEAYAPGVFARGGLIAAGGGFLGAVVAVIGSLLRARSKKHLTTYGSARWASAHDVRKAGLLVEDGVFLGRWKSAYLRHDGPEHVMAFAPTRSGKGVGLVVPTLLGWTGSAVIHDIKGENWDLTSGWRSRFSHCLRFEPTDTGSVRFNPLMEVRRGDNEVRDVQNIADILVDPEGSLERRNHWEKTGHALLVGVILHVLYAETDKTLAGCARFLSDPDRSFEATLSAMMNTPHLGSAVHPIVAQAARELLNKSENERSGVLSTAMSFLGLYRDPVIASATSASDWRIADLIEGKRPCSLYLVIPPSDISRTKPLVRLILNQIGRRLTEDLPRKGERRRKVLLMLDEFPALGRLDFFESALAFMAGYGMRAYLIAQSLNQIEKAYGPNNAILDNCHVRIAFATNDERTAKRISDALGTTTQQRAQRNYAGHRLAPWLSHVMVSAQETQRPLLTPGEVMQLPSDEELVMVSGARPLKAKKLRYFEDRNFTARVLPPPTNPFLPERRGHDWDGVLASVEPVPPTVSPTGSDEGGLQHSQTPSLDPPEKETPAREEVPDLPKEDGELDAAAVKSLKPAQRALGMDRADGDFFPKF